MDVNGSGRGLF